MSSVDNLSQILENDSLRNCRLTFHQGRFEARRRGFFHSKGSKGQHRTTLIALYEACVAKLAGRENPHALVQHAWHEEAARFLPASEALPSVLTNHSYVHMYAEGEAPHVELFSRIWTKLDEVVLPIASNPAFEIHHTENGSQFHDVSAVPAGLMPKLFHQSRIRLDEKLIPCIQSDLNRAAEIPHKEKRKLLTLQILAHSLAYREIEEKIFEIPDFLSEEPNQKIQYRANHHLIGHGVKTVSLQPVDEDKKGSYPGLYLCQGTEIFPSFPSMLGSLLANFGQNGSASEPFSEDRVLIEHHLKALKHNDDGALPIVLGHSMGGALASLIAAHLGDHIEQGVAFNPVSTNIEVEAPKLHVYANIDDFAFWRIGSKVIGKIHLIMANSRWEQLPIKVLDILFVIPAITKLILNLYRNFPAHQKIFSLQKDYLIVPLSADQVAQENGERTRRPDYIGYFPKLRKIVYYLMKCGRFIFGWRLQEIHNQKEVQKNTLIQRLGQ